MATLSKKLYFINSAGTQQSANLYSTTDESGSPYMSATVDGVAAYAPLVSPSDSNATAGRVLTSGGTTYAIGKSAVPTYQYQLINAVGSGTFTVPSGVSKLRVTVVGGGAGGSSGFVTPSTPGYAAGDCSNPVVSATTAVGGGTTTFGSVSAAGGTDFVLDAYSTQSTCSASSRDGSYTCYPLHIWVRHVSMGLNSGYLSTSGDGVSGGAAVPLTTYAGTQIATAGNGGYADSGNTSVSASCGAAARSYVCPGGSGYRTVSTISVTAGQTIAYTVGGGGNWYRKGSNAYYSYEWGTSGHHGSPGGGGAILVEWGKGIE